MMFGAHATEEWSSDEGEDMDLDDDEDDDEYDEEDYYESDQENDFRKGGAQKSKGSEIWEPQAKNYSPMNLKESIRNERQNTEGNDAETTEAKKRLKNAKKRAEKRRKQKEKKQRETSAQKNSVNENVIETSMETYSVDRYASGPLHYGMLWTDLVVVGKFLKISKSISEKPCLRKSSIAIWTA
jgi:hypothetical protein